MNGAYPHVVILTLIIGLLLTACGKKEEMRAPSAPTNPPVPPVVLVSEARQMESPVLGEVIAKLDGSSSAVIASPISGYLIKQAYQEGAVVKKNDLLFLIDAKMPSGYVKITSPTTGVAGRAVSGVGDWVTPGATLATVSEVDPIRADFALTERSFLNNGDRSGKVPPVGLQEHPESVELIMADGTAYPQKGQLFLMSHQTQGAKGVMAAYALFPNPDRVLRPGQYAKVRGVAQRSSDAVLIPQRSVSQLQGIYQVMVVKPDNTVEVRNVTLGDRVGSDGVITSGLKAGERVIVEGTQKVQQSSLVTPQPYVVPVPSNP